MYLCECLGQTSTLLVAQDLTGSRQCCHSPLNAIFSCLEMYLISHYFHVNVIQFEFKILRIHKKRYSALQQKLLKCKQLKYQSSIVLLCILLTCRLMTQHMSSSSPQQSSHPLQSDALSRSKIVIAIPIVSDQIPHKLISSTSDQDCSHNMDF